MAEQVSYRLGTGLIIKDVYDTETQVTDHYLITGYSHMTPSDRQEAVKTHSIELTVLGMDLDGTDLNINTLGDLHLIPQERPVIAFPKPITSYVEVPGYKQREVDMSEALTGDVMFGPREGTLSFYYENLYRSVSKYHLPTVTEIDHVPTLVNFLAFKMDDPEYHRVNADFYYWYKEWRLIYYALAHYVNGRRIKLKLLDDPDYYYTGRLSVTNFKSGQDSFGTVELTYKLDPYRIKEATGEQVL